MVAVVCAAVVAGVVVAAPAGAAPNGGGAARTLARDVAAVRDTGAVGVTATLDTPQGVRSASAGESEIGTGRPVRDDAHYRAGSTMKTFVASVVLQLVGEGELALSDSVDRWLPGTISGHGNDGRRITIRHLLQHTSGLANYTSYPELFPAGHTADGYLANRYRQLAAADLVAGAITHPPNFEPGTNWRYSNTNYLVLGMVIEKVTGRPWQQEVTRRLVRPLGLRHTSVPSRDPYLRTPYTHGYHTFAPSAGGGPGRQLDTTVMNPSAADAAGALVTTPADVNAFFRALIDGRVLRPAELAEMQTLRPMPDEPGRGYGLGIETTPLSCGGFYWHHGGNALGYASENGVTTDGRRAVTVVVNSFTDADGDQQDRTDAAVKRLIDRALCTDGT
ncbi:serine hydrolase domain-containing protein [Streptomyces sp. 796.1]|uniref:serine hydrolase domain-containing protein n=1 Tax=Streptomyces sp. 796.1 TaxID=3163029 RepID=UPI0039C96DCA